MGGDFNQALARIKAIGGRSYDSATRAWSVPIDAKSFQEKVMLPIEMPDGGHVTRYGNRYASNEWAADREARQVRVVKTGERREIAEWAKGEIAKWIASDKIDFVFALIDKGTIAQKMEYGEIKFSTPEKEQAIMAIAESYWAKDREIRQAEEDAEWAEKDRIYGKWGIS